MKTSAYLYSVSIYQHGIARELATASCIVRAVRIPLFSWLSLESSYIEDPANEVQD